MHFQPRRIIESVAILAGAGALFSSDLQHSNPVHFWLIAVAFAILTVSLLLAWRPWPLDSPLNTRFKSYIDAGMVGCFLNNPAAGMEAQQKEVTVVFTDLAGFSSVSAPLKEKAALLNDFMSLMVPIVRRHGGYLNKLLGDGMMFFFNAPRDNARHARDAVACILEMQAALSGFNRASGERGLSPLRLYCGIATGHVVVGNVGPADHSFADYTVFGDNVNLASRLQVTNRRLGTVILLNDRARELAGDAFLCRAIGILNIVGHTQGVTVHEPLAAMDQATDQQKRLATMTGDMVQAFIRADFQHSLSLAHSIAAEFGTTGITAAYAAECERHLKTPPEQFAGQLILGEE